MDFKQFELLFGELKFNYKVYTDNLIDFDGMMQDRLGNDYDVEGSMELVNNTVFYSIYFYDVNKQYEYDCMTGNINDVNKQDIINLLTPDFVYL